MSGANLAAVALSGANFSYVNLAGACVSDVDLEGVDCEGTRLDELQSCQVSETTGTPRRWVSWGSH
ncbi:MAG: pentapeptide repeat-containing protein [Leptolyngbyaceae cyanobacterium SL_1_1]|nr:pentapeptide repeat-containing protein [Leptolyngbyaceae cyanobacterium SL_1_1]